MKLTISGTKKEDFEPFRKFSEDFEELKFTEGEDFFRVEIDDIDKVQKHFLISLITESRRAKK